MAHDPRRVYGYGVPPPPPHQPQPTKYCYEEADPTCMGDFSESEGLSDGYGVPPAADVTEIYRRKLPHEIYHHPNVYYPSDYYYENVTTTNVPAPQVRRTIATTPGAQAYLRRRLHDERVGRYYNYTTEQIQEAYDTVTFRSTPQIATVRTPPTPPAPQPPQQATRRHPPVTIRTPRYFRRCQMTPHKRPSALCLPVAAQRDPAVYRRTRKLSSADPIYTQHPHQPVQLTQQQQQQQHQLQPPTQQPTPSQYRSVPSKTVPVYHPATSADVTGNTTETTPELNNVDLETMLARYEKMIRDPESQDEEQERRKEGVMKEERKVHDRHLFKPRVPMSIRSKNEKIQKLKVVKPPCPPSVLGKKEGERVEVEEMTTEVLDNLLVELMRTGCENKIEGSGTKKDDSRTPTEPPTPKKKDKECKEHKEHKEHKEQNMIVSKPECEMPKSINYQEIADQLVEMRRDSASNSASEKNQEVKQYPVDQLQETMLLSRTPTRPSHTSLFESAAVQLHRSKSYIVNLIDRALSKELGTIPEPRYPKHKDLCHVNELESKAAVDRQFERKIDKELHAEITQTFTESLVNNHTCKGHAQVKDPILEVCCSCNSCGGAAGGGSGEEEPLYLRQLKALRWGHLRKIQKEVRRLEDIERFLDSCSSRTNF